jgi:hypothetical protein
MKKFYGKTSTALANVATWISLLMQKKKITERFSHKRSSTNVLLTGEIDCPSTGRVSPVRGCLNNPSVWGCLNLKNLAKKS